MSASRAVILSVLAIVIAVAAVGVAFTARPAGPAPAKREFYIVTPEFSFNETIAGIPHYAFSPTQLTVNRGDDVLVHFYNTADDTHHTFTMPAYNINVDLAPGKHQDIEFTANQAGVFPFGCTFHPQTMRGELIVLSS
jgi:heme/copper-type cytochrome/quinol oxidase subunit 2